MFNIKIIGKEFKIFDEINSTQDYAHQNLRDGFLVIAKNQTNARGTHGKAWESGIGGIYFSFVIKPKIKPDEAGIIVKLVSVSIIEALEKIEKKEKKFKIKAPNDILIDDYGNWKKLAGILLESSTTNSTLNHIVVGVGINFKNNIPEHLKDIACNLKNFTREKNSLELIKNIVETIDFYYSNLSQKKDVIEKQYKKFLNRIS